MVFAQRSEHDLAQLDDAALLDHARRARAAGDRPQSVLALRVLVFGHWHRVARRVALKVAPADVDAVTSDVVFSAIRSAFDGDSAGEFTVWLNTITDRRIADHHRRRAATPAMATIGGEGDGGASLQMPDRSDEGLVETCDAVERTLATLSDTHARAVERHVLQGVPAREVAEELGLGADNVAQIASRFRRRLRELLDSSEDS